MMETILAQEVNGLAISKGVMHICVSLADGKEAKIVLPLAIIEMELAARPDSVARINSLAAKAA